MSELGVSVQDAEAMLANIRYQTDNINSNLKDVIIDFVASTSFQLQFLLILSNSLGSVLI